MGLRPAPEAVCGHHRCVPFFCLRICPWTRPCYDATMILYKPGTQFLFKGRIVTVDYVIIRKAGMWVRLVGKDVPCLPEELTPL